MRCIALNIPHYQVIFYYWDDVELFAQELEFDTVPVLFKGIVKSEKELQALTLKLMKEPSVCGGEREGVVIRVAREFDDAEFSECVQKMVRKGHITTDIHWKQKEIEKNGLVIKE
jgi:hypothetical protein